MAFKHTRHGESLSPPLLLLGTSSIKASRLLRHPQVPHLPQPGQNTGAKLLDQGPSPLPAELPLAQPGSSLPCVSVYPAAKAK